MILCIKHANKLLKQTACTIYQIYIYEPKKECERCEQNDITVDIKVANKIKKSIK